MYIKFLGEHLAEIIAICALGLTFYQAYLSRKHNRLSLKPHLTRFIHVLQEQQNGVLCFEIINNGVGPAFIKSFKVFMNGNLISNVESEIKNLLDDYQNTLTVINLTDDYVMKSGEK